MSFANRYIAIPYRDHGRDWDGADCFGVYALMLAHEAALDFRPLGYGKSVKSDPALAARTIEAEIARGQWIEVATGKGNVIKPLARKLDAVLMIAFLTDPASKVIRRVDRLHIGCALGDGTMLHIERNTGSRVLAIDDSEISWRVQALCRPAALMDRAA